MSRSILAQDKGRNATIIGALKAGYGPLTNLTTFESGPLTNPTTFESGPLTNPTTFETGTAKSNTTTFEDESPTSSMPAITTQTMAVTLTEGGLHSTMFNDTSTTRSTLASRAATLSNSAINGTQGVTSTKTTGSTGLAETLQSAVTAKPTTVTASTNLSINVTNGPSLVNGTEFQGESALSKNKTAGWALIGVLMTGLTTLLCYWKRKLFCRFWFKRNNTPTLTTTHLRSTTNEDKKVDPTATELLNVPSPSTV